MLREFLDVEELSDQGIGVAKELEGCCGIFRTDAFGDGFFNTEPVFENVDGGGGVESDPCVRVFIFRKKRQSAEAMPTAGLAPNRDTNHVFRFLQLTRERFAGAADK